MSEACQKRGSAKIGQVSCGHPRRRQPDATEAWRVMNNDFLKFLAGLGARPGCRSSILGWILLATVVVTLSACTPAGSGSSIEPPTPLSNVTPDMLNPDGTFKKNGLAPVDPSEQI